VTIVLPFDVPLPAETSGDPEITQAVVYLVLDSIYRSIYDQSHADGMLFAARNIVPATVRVTLESTGDDWSAIVRFQASSRVTVQDAQRFVDRLTAAGPAAQRGYHRQAVGNCGELEHVETAAECEMAAGWLEWDSGSHAASVEATSNPALPSGCFWDESRGRLSFNPEDNSTYDDGTSTHASVLICRTRIGLFIDLSRYESLNLAELGVPSSSAAYELMTRGPRAFLGPDTGSIRCGLTVYGDTSPHQRTIAEGFVGEALGGESLAHNYLFEIAEPGLVYTFDTCECAPCVSPA